MSQNHSLTYEMNGNSIGQEDPVDFTEMQIVEMFLTLPKDRQRALLAELWSEFKPEKPKGLRNFNNLPY